MCRCFTLLVIAVLLAVHNHLSAADLASIDRSIANEPTYKSQNVRYGLLVFGPDAKTRVWLVHDGDTLYVDRNANGDLTDEGEKFLPILGPSTNAATGDFYFRAGDISEGTLLHRGLEITASRLGNLPELEPRMKEVLARDPEAGYFSVALDMEMPGWKGDGLDGRVVQFASHDEASFLCFARSAEEAPVVHFRGPLQIVPDSRQQLRPARERYLYLALGAPGLGTGSTAYIAYEGVVPETAFPIAEITYARTSADDPPLRERYELKHRC